MKTLQQLLDETYGKIGTATRRQFESECKTEIWKERVAKSRRLRKKK